MHNYRPIEERRRDWKEVEIPLTPSDSRMYSKACLSCGIPFCHGMGCPLANVIPETNAAVAVGDDALAYRIHSQTNPFPEFTSRICASPCEGSCTQGMNGGNPVAIRSLERHIIDTAFANGWVKPNIPAKRTGHHVAVIGAGPAGLAAAEMINRSGVAVTVYERAAAPGGLLRYGIPDFKLDKEVIARRIRIMEEEGIRFITNTEIGKDISPEWLAKRYDAVVWAIGTAVPRDLKVPGRELEGIHFALELLQGQNRTIAGEIPANPISAKGKDVLVIGGGDTGSDCVGTSIRQGAKSVTQVEIMPMPPEKRSPSTPWPQWPYMLRTSSSHEEGCERLWDIDTICFEGAEGHVTGVKVRSVKWELSPFGKPLSFQPVPNSERLIKADLVLLAMGFTGVPQNLLEALPHQEKRALLCKDAKNFFACGDCVSGPSLVVRAMADGKRVANDLLAHLGVAP